jgi:hypothetical protein
MRSNIYKYRSLYNKEKENMFINDFIFKIKESLFKDKTRILKGDIEFYLLKRQDVRLNKAIMRKRELEDMERKASTPVNLKDYTL